jgi:hypothetical protein
MIVGSKVLPLYNKVDAVRYGGRVVYTNHVPAGAYRGYGAIQGNYALEATIDILAEKLGMDPKKIREINSMREKETSPIFEIMGEGTKGTAMIMESCKLPYCIDRGAELIDWKNKYPRKQVGPHKVRSVGCAIAMPVAEEFHKLGAEVTSIIGFRNKDLVILEDEFKSFSDHFYLTTDDESYGEKGPVTVPLKRLLDAGEKFDEIITIGPLIMMKFVVATARPYNIPVTVSMNPIMIDGTGMCGGCRLSLVDKDGKRTMKFACVDGPDFDGYEVDFDEAMARSRQYFDFERHAHEEACNLFKKEAK